MNIELVNHSGTVQTGEHEWLFSLVLRAITCVIKFGVYTRGFPDLTHLPCLWWEDWRKEDSGELTFLEHEIHLVGEKWIPSPWMASPSLSWGFLISSFHRVYLSPSCRSDPQWIHYSYCSSHGVSHSPWDIISMPSASFVAAAKNVEMLPVQLSSTESVKDAGSILPSHSIGVALLEPAETDSGPWVSWDGSAEPAGDMDSLFPLHWLCLTSQVN